MRIFALLRVGPAFKAWRGRSQHRARPADRRAQHRHVPRVIEDAVFLFVRGVVLFIDNDQPQVLKRQKQRRPRAHHHLRLPFGHHAPDAAAFGHGHARVPLGRFRAKAFVYPGQELLGQRDLGQQHQRLPPGAQGRRHGLQVHLGLARPGHALQQRGAIGSAGHALGQPRGRLGLICGQLFARQRGIQRRKGRIARAVLFGDHALRHQPLDDGCRHSRHLGQLFQRKGQRAVLLERLYHPRARRRGAVRLSLPQPVDLAHRRRIAQPGRPRRQTQHRGQRRQRVIGGAHQECLHFLSHRRHVQHPDDAAHLGRVVIARARAPDHAQHLARPQRHLDKRAGKTPALGRAVIQRPSQRLRRQHGHQPALIEEIAQLTSHRSGLQSWRRIG